MTVYLVRHASAGERNAADPDDWRRPLDDRGRTQAERIAELLAPRLADHPSVRLVASPADRCIQTLEPLAALLGLPVKSDDALLEGATVDRPWELVESAARTGDDLVACSHGDIIPDVVDRAIGRGMAVDGPSGCSKGSIWTLTWDGEAFRDRQVHQRLTPRLTPGPRAAAAPPSSAQSSVSSTRT